MVIAIIHQNWDSDIVLDRGELECLLEGGILSGEIADYNILGKVFLSKWEEDNLGLYFNLEWDKKYPNIYFFKINSEGILKLRDNNYVHGRYYNGLNGSKLSIYNYEKDNLIKENIEFSIEMIRSNKNIAR